MNKFSQEFQSIKTSYKKLKEMVGHNLAVVTMHKSIDAACKLMQEHETKKITCQKGCNFCCYEPVECTTQEVKLMMQYAKFKNIEIDKNRLKKQIAFRRSNRQNLTSYQKSLGNDALCVFNQPDGSCGVYEARPSFCRSWFVSSPKENCTPGRKSKIKIVASQEIVMLANVMASVDEKTTIPDAVWREIERL